MDIRLATEWVRDNIAQFGGMPLHKHHHYRGMTKPTSGDPKRITIFGESAGGFAVDYYAYAWPQDPIVNGFIAQSGTVSGGKGMGRDRPANYDMWYKLSAGLGCGGADAGAKTVECVRGKTGDEVSKKANELKLSFGPRADGKVVFADNEARGKAGNFIKRVCQASLPMVCLGD